MHDDCDAGGNVECDFVCILFSCNCAQHACPVVHTFAACLSSCVWCCGHLLYLHLVIYKLQREGEFMNFWRVGIKLYLVRNLM